MLALALGISAIAAVTLEGLIDWLDQPEDTDLP